MRPNLVLSSLALVAVVAAAGCGNAVSTSLPVGINLQAKAADAVTTVNADKNITTESGNPYGAFITAAQKALGGKDPSRIEIDSATILLGANSTSVTGLEQVFAGRVDVVFLMNDTNNTFQVAHLDSVSGSTPLDLKIDWDPGLVAGVDQKNLLAGAFKVVARGAAATAFQSKGPVANLQVTFKFTALE